MGVRDDGHRDLMEFMAAHGFTTSAARIRRHDLRDEINLLKHQRGCDNCGERDSACLQYHHRDPATKRADVSSLISKGYHRRAVLAEIGKCRLLCNRCHKRLHKLECSAKLRRRFPDEAARLLGKL